MTHKDFVLLASVLADARAQIATTPQLSAMAGHRLTCEALADALRTANPRFDRERFLRECILIERFANGDQILFRTEEGGNLAGTICGSSPNKDGYWLVSVLGGGGWLVPENMILGISNV